MEGEWAYIGGGTMARSVYRKEKMGAPKKPATYLHIQIESGTHQVGRTLENVNTPPQQGAQQKETKTIK